MHLLQAAAFALQPCGAAALLYLAAAVSDFYIPTSDLVGIVLNFLVCFLLLVKLTGMEVCFLVDL